MSKSLRFTSDHVVFSLHALFLDSDIGKNLNKCFFKKRETFTYIGELSKLYTEDVNNLSVDL